MTFTEEPLSATLGVVEGRRFRLSSFVEWIIAAVAVAAVVWVLSVPAQRLMGRPVEASLIDAPAALPPGVPSGARHVPVMYLLDGREIRHGELLTRLLRLLPDRLMDGPVVRAAGEHGERQTRLYVVDGTKFYVVSERDEPGAPLRVSGIYLP